MKPAVVLDSNGGFTGSCPFGFKGAQAFSSRYKYVGSDGSESEAFVDDMCVHFEDIEGPTIWDIATLASLDGFPSDFCKPRAQSSDPCVLVDPSENYFLADESVTQREGDFYGGQIREMRRFPHELWLEAHKLEYASQHLNLRGSVPGVSDGVVLANHYLTTSPVIYTSRRPGEYRDLNSRRETFPLLVHVIQNVTGMFWRDAIQTYVLDPLGASTYSFGWTGTNTDPLSGSKQVSVNVHPGGEFITFLARTLFRPSFFGFGPYDVNSETNSNLREPVDSRYGIFMLDENGEKRGSNAYFFSTDDHIRLLEPFRNGRGLSLDGVPFVSPSTASLALQVHPYWSYEHAYDHFNYGKFYLDTTAQGEAYISSDPSRPTNNAQTKGAGYIFHYFNHLTTHFTFLGSVRYLKRTDGTALEVIFAREGFSTYLIPELNMTGSIMTDDALSDSECVSPSMPLGLGTRGLVPEFPTLVGSTEELLCDAYNEEVLQLRAMFDEAYYHSRSPYYMK